MSNCRGEIRFKASRPWREVRPQPTDKSLSLWRQHGDTRNLQAKSTAWCYQAMTAMALAIAMATTLSMEFVLR